MLLEGKNAIVYGGAGAVDDRLEMVTERRNSDQARDARRG